ncbi:CehA/McbA family metallohydrolase [Dactylosporangium sp. NPDC005572]|uniref:CehA/McbA family metallohydrolase n=1 Tax=Dactylosporangium sp. NPDC005572 TaxID=3156889 RepID=UPI0033AB4E3C
MDRRQLLITSAKVGAATGIAGGAVTLDPVAFEAAAAPAPEGDSVQTRTISGRIEYGAPDWVYVPLEIPAGVNRITVSYSYDRPAAPPGQNGNALDIGLFDQNGIELGDSRGFRGWSGGFRTEFTVSASDATPGYLPGPIRKGTWHVIFGPYTVHPQGLNWTLNVTLTFGAEGAPFKPTPAPVKAKGRGSAWYRGDMHLHTVHSDGRRQPAELAAAARAAKLDFFVSTEHNTSSAAGVWGQHAGDDLLIVDGEEITTRNGHFTALGLPAGTWIDWRYRASDGALARFVQQIHRAGGLAVAAHPLATCVACGWRFGFAGLDAVEVWNGPWTLDDEAVVANWDSLLVAGGRTGQWIPAVGNSDAHSEPQVVGLPHNVVHAGGLDRRSILDGVRAGRLWIAESAGVDLTFTAAAKGRTVGIGQRLEVGDDEPVTVTLAVSGAGGCAVRLVTDQGQRLATLLPAEGTGTVSWTTNPRNSNYVRAEVRRQTPTPTTADTMVALTNPIFLGRVGGHR